MRPRKDTHIQIRIDEETKKRFERFAKSYGGMSLTQLILIATTAYIRSKNFETPRDSSVQPQAESGEN